MKSAALFLLLAVGACAAQPGDDASAVAAEITATPITFGDLSFNAYHSQDAIHAYLTTEATKHPDLVQFTKLGASRESRVIEYIVVSHKDPATVPAIYFNGTHHGDEWSSTEGILGLADYLIANHDDPAVKPTLDAYAIYLQPLVNPDGHDAKTREDSQGNDPNRDYAYPTGTVSDAFKLPEIQLVRDLLDRIKPHGAAAYHSGIEEVIWPWCYTGNGAPNAAVVSAAGKATAQAMGFDRYLQSYDDYPTDGEFIDYAFSKYNTLALTFEVSVAKTPSVSQLNSVVVNSVKGALAFIEAVKAVDAGHPLFAPGNIKGSEGAFGHRTTPRLE
jgi:hypothetical protein